MSFLRNAPRLAWPRTNFTIPRLSTRALLGLPLCLFACAVAVLAQSPTTGNAPVVQSQSSPSPKPAAAQASSDSLSGTVIDPTGMPVIGAQVKLSRPDGSPDQQIVSTDDGSFSFSNVRPGPFQLTISCDGFATQTLPGVVRVGEPSHLPPITLPLATVVAEVHVGVSTFELAQEQIHEQEEQRVLGFVPNFYVTYIPNAAPLNSRQKFSLAWKTTIDPVSIGLNAAAAGVQQATNNFAGYGQGAQGYAKRFGASYADFAISTFIGGAILPSVFHQDPRYFYKGTGTKRSRAMYAIANAVICKGDNGHWQFNYSGVLGSVASGGISNLYYPPGDRGASLIFENTAIGIGLNAGANLLQEFVIRKLTPNLPNHSQATP